MHYRVKFIFRICYRHKEKEEKSLMSALSLIVKQLSNKQLSNYDFQKRKYLKFLRQSPLVGVQKNVFLNIYQILWKVFVNNFKKLWFYIKHFEQSHPIDDYWEKMLY